LGGFDSAHPNGNVTETLEDDHAGTLTRTVYLPDGSVDFVEVTSIPVTAPYEPLGATGALATLLVVEGVVGLQDAANALGEEPGHLTHEALAWQVAADAGA
jgi:hypothetical protein